MKKRMLFVGLNHTSLNSRLTFYLAKHLKASISNLECIYWGIDSYRMDDTPNPYMHVARESKPVLRKKQLDIGKRLVRFVNNNAIDLVQVSDANELLYGYWIQKFSRVPVIYDAHEDYFNQRYEYGGKSAASLFCALKIRAVELLLARKMNAVFETDEFLSELYNLPAFGIHRHTLLRNIPEDIGQIHPPKLHRRKNLKLLYIGDITPVRGVETTARFLQKYNREHKMNHTMTVYGPRKKRVEELAAEGIINYEGFVSHVELVKNLSNYDVGLSLLHPLKKFERNIPTKNFEYLSAGLPFLTSNFGQMKKYADASQGGLAIDPLSYTAFKEALRKFCDVSFRKRCQQNGRAFFKDHLSREKEIAPYINQVKMLLMGPTE